MSLDGLIGALQGLGGWAYPLCLALMTVSSIVPVPAEAPAMVNGAVLGFVGGSAVTWLGAMIGAGVSYELADQLHRRFGHRVFSEKARQRLSSLGRDTSPGELMALRLTPVVAFHLLNYLAGVSRVPRLRFYLTTALGILPGALAFTGAGTAFSQWMVRSEVKWGAACLLVVLIMWRVVRARRVQVSSAG